MPMLFFFSSRRRHTRLQGDWSSDVCSSDLLRQGHQEDALRVYQALLTQRPGDARLRARVQALSPGGTGRGRTGESLPSFLKRILAGRLPAAAPDPIAPAPTLPPLPPSDPTPEVGGGSPLAGAFASLGLEAEPEFTAPGEATRPAADRDRKSTRLNSSHLVISYAVFCLKKKKKHIHRHNLD